MITVYEYPTCSTCKKALKWLDAQGIDYKKKHIAETPPSATTLKKALKSGIELKKLFNTSGQSYRNGGFKEKLQTMSDAEAIDALAADGKLIKRPLVAHDGGFLVGFKEAEWAAALG